ncbi:unnamed protein product [Bursaphelenchus xylophilus]|uniref:(pine wood nematode) hypothetical protein n=1 Tax=Bursaphelenchus xylophilus TaxID=6326 RepID=A0A1I7RVU2_BURXY|nr:unnamed protein product [Bursaphelenchus xylophilus]CAG9082179.1 unnamed protein product [Bursaphelenchus xylophilus]
MCYPAVLKSVLIVGLGISLVFTITATLLPDWRVSKGFRQGLFFAECHNNTQILTSSQEFLQACEEALTRPQASLVIVACLLVTSLTFSTVSFAWSIAGCCCSCVLCDFMAIGFITVISGVIELAAPIIFRLNDFPEDIAKDIKNRYERISNSTLDVDEVKHFTDEKPQYSVHAAFIAGIILLVTSAISVCIHKVVDNESE